MLATLDPSLPNLTHDIEAAVPTLNAYADAAPDLMTTARSVIQIDNTIVDQKQQLDEFLVSSIGLANIGNDVIGGNAQALTDVARLLVPTAELFNRYHDSLNCSIAGLAMISKTPPLPAPGAVVSASITLGTERYRYPQDLPKVAATGRPYCTEVGLPDVAPEFRVPTIVADVGADPYHYGNQGILLNSDALKQWLFGPIPGPPRNSTQTGQPG